jgi:hypothetical protein
MNQAPPHEDFLRLNDLEIYNEYAARREAQWQAADRFWTAFCDMQLCLDYTKRARTADLPSFARSCEELAQTYLLDAQDKDFPGRLNWYIQATENLLDVLNEMKRRL